jgi:hypothetical protein
MAELEHPNGRSLGDEGPKPFQHPGIGRDRGEDELERIAGGPQRFGKFFKKPGQRFWSLSYRHDHRNIKPDCSGHSNLSAASGSTSPSSSRDFRSATSAISPTSSRNPPSAKQSSIEAGRTKASDT